MKSTVRSVLEEICDLWKATTPKGVRRKPIVLHPPAPAAKIKVFLARGWSHPLPPSYGELLAASDGLDGFLGRLTFASTDPARQKRLRRWIEGLMVDEDLLETFVASSTKPARRAKPTARPERVVLSEHPIIAASDGGPLLLFDRRTVRANGEMDLCWIPPGAVAIKARYPNLRAYLESVRTDLQTAKK